MKKSIFTFLIFVLVSASAGSVAFAESAPQGCESGDKLSDIFCSTSLSEMLNSAFQVSISLGAILAMLRIGYAGYLYMGSDMWSKKEHAKEVFQDAIIGLLLLLAIWLILNQINPQILSLKLNGITPGQ